VWWRMKRWTDPVRVDLERVLSVRSLELNIVDARLNSQHRVPVRQSDRGRGRGCGADRGQWRCSGG
jgi:hypothetical protein